MTNEEQQKTTTSPIKLETEMVELTIDGQIVRVPKDTPIYDTVTSLGKTLPAMCYHYTFSPFGSCGICLVEVEGKKAPVRACSSNVAPGMVVRTDTPALFQSQKKAIERHLSTHPLDCPVCDADGRCELQDISFEFGISELKTVRQKGIPEDRRSLVLDFNMNRCILCAQCINVCKEVQQVDALQFLKKDGQTHVVAKGDTALYCEFCGDCLSVCPVGAITNKFAKYLYKPWQLTETTTTCGYCGDGCEMIIESMDQDVLRVRSPFTWKSKWGTKEDTLGGHGGICVKGRFGFQHINSEKRLTQPLVRTQDGFSPTSWWEATDLIANRLREIKAEHGPEAIAGLVSARLMNEELYLFQKFMRTVIGTNQFDSTARYGQINFTKALEMALGRYRLMNLYEELTVANVILVIGSDITEANPITALRVKEAMRLYGAKVIVVNPIKTKMAELATHHLAIKPGSDGAVLHGLIRALLANNLVDADVARENPELINALKQATASTTDEQLRTLTGLEAAQLTEVAELLARAERSILLCGEALLKQANGYANALSLIEVAALAGALSKRGSGVMALQEENNEQGVIDFGAVPELLPGPAAITDTAAITRATELWQAAIPTTPGATLPEILDRAREGKIKALYVIGENPIGSLPASFKAAEALERVDLLICQEVFMTETAERAAVVLPACTAAEKVGTFTNLEGEYCPVVRALEPRGESRPDWEIFEEIASKMDDRLVYGSIEELQQEISRHIDGFPITPLPRRLDGLPRFRPEHIATIAGRHHLSPPLAAVENGTIRLQLAPVLYHSGKLSLQADGLTTIYPAGRLGISPHDGERFGAATGAIVQLAAHDAPQRTVDVEVEVQPSLPPGLCFFPEHFNEPAVKELVSTSVDPTTQVPYFKQGRVTVKLVKPAPPNATPPPPSEPATATPPQAAKKESAS